MNKAFYIIGTLAFEVSEVDTCEPEVFGNTNYLTQEIKILKTLSPQNKMMTLIHELVHATIYAVGMASQKEWNNEQLCEFMACHGTHIIANAKNIMKDLGATNNDK